MGRSGREGMGRRREGEGKEIGRALKKGRGRTRRQGGVRGEVKSKG